MSAHAKRRLLPLCALLLLVAAAREREEQPDAWWSVQLHLHGPFSEGPASIDSHSHEGVDVGVDALWWSEHDFRVTSYHMLSRFDFDALERPLAAGEDWTPSGAWESERMKRVRAVLPASPAGSFEIAADGERTALRVSERATGAGPVRTALELVGDGATHVHPLAAGLELELWVRAEALPAGARGFVELQLSEHAPRAGRALEQLQLRYVLTRGPQPAGEPAVIGTSYTVPIVLADDGWTRLLLPVTADARTAFPEPAGEDNALHGIVLGLESEEQQEAQLWFDELALHRSRPPGEMFAAQAELLQRVGKHYPHLVQLQGLELSLATPHLNAFCSPDSGMDPADYDALIEAVGARDQLDELGRALVPLFVSEVHAAGGLVSLNHPFGASWGIARGGSRRRAVLEELVGSEAHGADLLEVGYRARGGHDLAEHLWVWDQLAREGLPLVGTGVSDSHGGEKGRWRTARNNFVSWVEAPAPDADGLLEGLRRGRVFFGDRLLFDGALDLATERGFRMGQVIVTDREHAEVRVLVREQGAERARAAQLVVSGKDHGRPLGTNDLAQVPLDPELPTVVRAELRGRDGPQALSNAIVFVRQPPTAASIAPRLALDLGGVVARRLDGFALREARVEPGAVVLAGFAASADLELDLTHFAGPRPARVELDGLTGAWSPTEDGIVLTGLSGEGELRVLPGS